MGTYADSWLEFEKSLGGVRPVLKGTAEEMRAQFSGLIAHISSQYPPLPDTISVSQRNVDGITIRIYTPTQRKTNGAPMGVFYHSGGFVVGGLDSEDHFCRTVATSTNVIIVSVDYHLSPENKAPAHLEDAVKLYEWCYANASTIGGDGSEIFTIGTSSGGCLALAVARKVVLGQTTVPTDAVKGVIALTPPALHPNNVPEAYQDSYLSYMENAENVPIVDKASMLQMFSDAGIQPNDERYFPLLDSDSLKLLPSTYICTCGQDVLRDDGKVLESALVSAGVSVKSDYYKSLPHCFWIFPSLPETAEFFNNLARGVYWILK